MPSDSQIVVCPQCAQEQFRAPACERCGADLSGAMQLSAEPRPPRRSKTQAQNIATVETLRLSETSGSSRWKTLVFSTVVLIALIASAATLIHRGSLGWMLESKSHNIEILKIEKRMSVPFRILEIEGRPYHQAPLAHRELMQAFDKSENQRLLDEIRQEIREDAAIESQASESFYDDESEDW